MIIRTLPGLRIDTDHTNAIAPVRPGRRRGVHQATSSNAPQQGVYQLVPRGGRTIMAAGNRYALTPVDGVRYYTLDGLDSIFSKIGKAIGKGFKAIGKAVGKVAKFALPVAGVALGAKFLLPIAKKGFSAIFHKGTQYQLPAPNPGIPLPEYNPPPIPYDMSQPSPGAYAPGPTYTTPPAGQTNPMVPAAGATDAEDVSTAPVAQANGQMPSWVMPAAIGGAALLVLMTMGKGGRRVRG